MSDLYDTDVVEWSERQARLLRGLAARQPSNELPDWDNIIEEVESVGRSQVDAVESLLTQAFLHELKVAAWPTSRDLLHWKAEARLFRRLARRKYTSSMRQKLDVTTLYGDALTGLPDAMDDQPGLPVPQSCPVTLDELLRE